MKKNLSNLDRIIRVIVSIALLIAYFTGVLPGVWAIVGLVVVVAFTLTGAIGWCPIYMALGMKTKKDE